MEPHSQFFLTKKDSAVPESDFTSTGNVVRTDKTLVVKGLFTVDDLNTQMQHGQIVARRGVSGNYSTATTDYIVAITSLATTPSIGLPRPSVVGVGKIYIIKDEVGGAASTTITVRSAGEETIDGSSTSTLTTNYQSRSYYSNGTNWFTY